MATVKAVKKSVKKSPAKRSRHAGKVAPPLATRAPFGSLFAVSKPPFRRVVVTVFDAKGDKITGSSHDLTRTDVLHVRVEGDQASSSITSEKR